MKKIKILSYTFLGLLIISCIRPEVEPIPEIRNDCVYVEGSTNHGRFMDEEKEAMVRECQENLLPSKQAIEENLIGEWKLIGYFPSWFPDITPPCIYLTILDDRIIIDYNGLEELDSVLDTTYSYPWEIVENGNNYFRLKTEPGFRIGLSIQTFCENYMYQNESRTDGDNYLYEKVK